MIEIQGLRKLYDDYLAVDDMSFTLRQGQICGLVGPNGAGKTTLFNAIAGDITPTEGSVTIKGVDCTSLPSRLRPRFGVARTYQKTRLFGGLTVEDNLYLAQTGKAGRHLSLRKSALDRDMRAKAREAGERIWLQNMLDSPVDDLSHGQKRQLEIGLALVTNPDLIMLDEPASGLSRGEREQLIELLLNLPSETTMCLIEHDMDVALKVSDRVVVMADGVTVATGTPEEIRANPLVHAIYLGTEG